MSAKPKHAAAAAPSPAPVLNSALALLAGALVPAGRAGAVAHEGIRVRCPPKRLAETQVIAARPGSPA